MTETNKYPERCHVAGCPCGYFSAKSPSESPALRERDVDRSVWEAKNVLSSDSEPNSPILATDSQKEAKQQ